LTPNSRSIDLTELRKSEKSSTIRKLFWFHASIEIPVTGEKISPEATAQRVDIAAPGFCGADDSQPPPASKLFHIGAGHFGCGKTPLNRVIGGAGVKLR
jgi:hypothetical protein